MKYIIFSEATVYNLLHIPITYNAIGGGGFLLYRPIYSIDVLDCERENKYFLKN